MSEQAASLRSWLWQCSWQSLWKAPQRPSRSQMVPQGSASFHGDEGAEGAEGAGGAGAEVVSTGWSLPAVAFGSSSILPPQAAVKRSTPRSTRELRTKDRWPRPPDPSRAITWSPSVSGRIRTCDLSVRNRLLYPAELRRLTSTRQARVEDAERVEGLAALTRHDTARPACYGSRAWFVASLPAFFGL